MQIIIALVTLMVTIVLIIAVIGTWTACSNISKQMKTLNYYVKSQHDLLLAQHKYQIKQESIKAEGEIA